MGGSTEFRIIWVISSLCYFSLTDLLSTLSCQVNCLGIYHFPAEIVVYCKNDTVFVVFPFSACAGEDRETSSRARLKPDAWRIAAPNVSTCFGGCYCVGRSGMILDGHDYCVY